jgi:hypothetical protein
MKVLPLIGAKSIAAFCSFNKLLLGYKMLPAYAGETYEVFFEHMKEKTDAQKESIIREALAFVALERDEIEALASFVADRNGVPYSPTSLKNLSLKEIFEIIIAVCMEIGRIDISLISEDEKKNCLSLAST